MSTPTPNSKSGIDFSVNNLVAKAVHFVQSLILPFMRPIDTGSFGRIVCTFLLFISYYYSWRLSKDIPATLLTVLEAMLLYVFGSKVYTGYTDFKKSQVTKLASGKVAAAPSSDDSDSSDSSDDAATSK